ncbi:MAG: DUF4126 domain-containing protein [Flavisolibacter sp.]|nr:DUF4126 domain-containing protein [Flavisolibacter sp.]
MQWLSGLCLGIALSSCCGFRIFVPMLLAGIAVKLDWIHANAGFQWLGSWPALLVLGIATIIEIAAYYIPWLDHALDAIAAPVAFAAGTLLTTSFITIDAPLLKWGLGIIAGGGTAGLIHTGMGLLRLGSTATTGGIANPVVSTGENVASIGFSLFSIFLPLIAGLLTLIFLFFFIRFIIRKKPSWKKLLWG